MMTSSYSRCPLFFLKCSFSLHVPEVYYVYFHFFLIIINYFSSLCCQNSGGFKILTYIPSAFHRLFSTNWSHLRAVPLGILNIFFLLPYFYHYFHYIISLRKKIKVTLALFSLFIYFLIDHVGLKSYSSFQVSRPYFHFYLYYTILVIYFPSQTDWLQVCSMGPHV